MSVPEAIWKRHAIVQPHPLGQGVGGVDEFRGEIDPGDLRTGSIRDEPSGPADPAADIKDRSAFPHLQQRHQSFTGFAPADVELIERTEVIHLQRVGVNPGLGQGLQDALDDPRAPVMRLHGVGHGVSILQPCG